MYFEQEVLFPSAQRTTAVANSAGTNIYEGAWKKAVFMLDLTASGGAAGDTLDVFVDVLAPDGSTYLNAVHFTQLAGNASATKRFAVLDSTSVAATDFAVATDCTSGVTKPYLFGPKVRGRYTLVNAGGGTQNMTFSLTAYFIK